jgi:hypothetical protein
MCADFTPNFGDKRTGYCIATTHHLTLPFSPKHFLRKATLRSSASHPTFLFHRLKIKQKVRHFDTIEVIEAESQAVLNTLTKHDIEDAFKKINRIAGNGGYAWKVFYQMAAPIPEIMYITLYHVYNHLFELFCYVPIHV